LRKSSTDGGTWWDSVVAAATEILFVILPIIVVTIVTTHKHGAADLFASPEWSFVSAILFGQAAVKMIAVAASGAIAERASMLGALAIVCGLVPSLIVLVFLLNEDGAQQTLRVAQMILFTCGILTFAIFGATAHYLHTHADTAE